MLKGACPQPHLECVLDQYSVHSRWFWLREDLDVGWVSSVALGCSLGWAVDFSAALERLRRNGKKTSQIGWPMTLPRPVVQQVAGLWKNTAINDGWDIDELLQLDKTKFWTNSHVPMLSTYLCHEYPTVIHWWILLYIREYKYHHYPIAILIRQNINLGLMHQS